MALTSALTKSLTDPKESRQCVDEPAATSAREQEPASVTCTGLIRFDFPGVKRFYRHDAAGPYDWDDDRSCSIRGWQNRAARTF